VSPSLRLALVSVVASLSVGVVYVFQPLVTLIAAEFSVTPTAANSVATTVLVGYAIGVLVLIALSDRVQARAQVQWQALATAAFLALAASAPNFVVLCIAAFGAGVCASTAQILLASMVRSASPGRAGSTTSLLAGALLIGILGSRILAGVIGGVTGWRLVVAGLAVLMLLGIPVLRVATPRQDLDPAARYGAIMRGLPALLVGNRVLATSALTHFAVFAGFQAVWSLLVVDVTGAPLSWTVGAAGLVGLVGLAAGAATLRTGRLVDRFGSRRVLAAAFISLLLGALLIAGFTSVPAVLIAALFIFTVGLQVEQVSTQSLAMQSSGAERVGQANSLYMFLAFAGGSIGSAIGAGLFDLSGYRATALFAAGCVLVAVALQVVASRSANRDSRRIRNG
jgi:predicted MFS family arabinose efflux permease